MRNLLASTLALTALLGGAYAQTAPAPVTVIGPGGIHPTMEQLIKDYSAKTGTAVKGTYTPGGAAKQAAVQGGPFDIYIVEPPYTDVITSGNVVPDSIVTLGTVSLVLVVKEGAPHPDISTPATAKKVLLAAQSITYPDAATGAGAGVTAEEMFKNLGIEEQMRPKIKHAGGMAEVAKGNVEIGVTFLSQLDQHPGLDVIGTFPADIAPPTVFGAFLSSHATDPAAAKQFLKYITSPEGATAYTAHGLAPNSKSR